MLLSYNQIWMEIGDSALVQLLSPILTPLYAVVAGPALQVRRLLQVPAREQVPGAARQGDSWTVDFITVGRYLRLETCLIFFLQYTVTRKFDTEREWSRCKTGGGDTFCLWVSSAWTSQICVKVLFNASKGFSTASAFLLVQPRCG